MDVSDGLAGDLGKLCDVSGVSAEIEVARVPLSEAAARRSRAEPALIEKVLTGGDDYECVAPFRPEGRGAAPAATAAGVPVTEIGTYHGREGDGRGSSAATASRCIQADVLQPFLNACFPL